MELQEGKDRVGRIRYGQWEHIMQGGFNTRLSVFLLSLDKESETRVSNWLFILFTNVVTGLIET